MDITYQITCRDCLCSLNVDHMYIILNADVEEYKRKTEYEVTSKMIEIFHDEEKRCSFCGSTNRQPMNIEIDNYPLYDFDRISIRGNQNNEQMIMLSLTKKENKIVSQVAGRTKGVITQFLVFAILDLIEKINHTQEKDFTTHKKGDFFVCYTGFYNNSQFEAELQLERLYYYGISKQEILDELIKRRKEFLALVFPSVGL